MQNYFVSTPRLVRPARRALAVSALCRPGSGDPQREITAPEEINDILDWFSGVKVRPALVRYGGSSLALIFYAPDAAEPLRVNVVRDICYHFSSAGHDASAGLLLAGLRDVWAPFPAS